MDARVKPEHDGREHELLRNGAVTIASQMKSSLFR